jgi:transposase
LATGTAYSSASGGGQKKGVWKSLFNALVEDPDFEYLIIDSTIVRAHQHAARQKGGTEDEAIGRSRDGA